MRNRIPIGTLVRVRHSALIYNSDYAAVNRRLVAEHGYLWFVQKSALGNPEAYVCKSLATGVEDDNGTVWFYHELEEAPTDE